ncbi:MAG: hypothetical protein WEA82_00300 [Idiomarina sp.]
MELNATLVGQVVVVFAIIVGILSYYLGKRKTNNPVIAGVLGALLSLIPVLGLIYLAVLLLKSNVKND